MAFTLPSIDITPYLNLIPFLKLKLPATYVLAGRVIDVDAFIDRVTADGKLGGDDIATAAAIWFGSANAPVAPKPPVHVPPPPVVIGDDDTPDVPPVVTVGKVASIKLSRIRAVLSGQRFPKLKGNELQVEPNPAGNFNYATAVTFEAELLDAAGNTIDTGAHGGVGHTHTTVYRCVSPDGSAAQIGPGIDFAQGTRTIGAGGKNYVDTNGTNATFRFGFAETAVEGEFTVWAEDSGVESPKIVSRVS